MQFIVRAVCLPIFGIWKRLHTADMVRVILSAGGVSARTAPRTAPSHVIKILFLHRKAGVIDYLSQSLCRYGLLPTLLPL